MHTRRQRMRRVAVAVWVIVALACALGCRRDAKPKKARPPVPEPILPTAAAGGATAAPTPAWVEALPSTEVSVSVGERTWAALAQRGSEMVELGVYTVEAIHDSHATLKDRMGQKTRGVPGALIHPLGTSHKLEEGEPVLFYLWTAPGQLGRIKKIRGDKILVQYDWAGATKQAVPEHLERPVRGIAPLAYVGYPKFGNTSRGQLVALDDERGWVRTSSGHVEMHPRDKLERLQLVSEGFDVGDRVKAYSWSAGFEPGTVAKILEPSLRYEVKLDGPRPLQSYFIANLVVSR